MEYINSREFVYAYIVINNKFKSEEDKLIGESLVKGFLKFFTHHKPETFSKSFIYKGEFKNNGIIAYWLKNHCPYKKIYATEDEIKNYMYLCKDKGIPYNELFKLNPREIKCLIVGPYWTNKLIQYNLNLHEHGNN